MSRHHVVTLFGTRPEAIKLAPVVQELERRSEEFEHTVVTTGQHREMLQQVLSTFDIRPDVDLELMQHDQTLAEFAARALSSVAALFAKLKPDAVLVQGDTTTVMSTAMAGFYQGVVVGHVEAGLRSYDRRNPFPEEINRRVAGCVADLHFAPTEGARQNLLREGVLEPTVYVTGNTIVDALQSITLDATFEDPRLNHVDFTNKRILLVTAHRRENHGAPIRSICKALKKLVTEYPDVEVVYPVHLNPNVRKPVFDELGHHPQIHLTSPASYTDLLRLMKQCFLILTDSGGIQEEAPSFHKPVLILREVTERPEVVEVGAGRIVGTDSRQIVRATTQLLTDPAAYRAMSTTVNPFGDGQAAVRIADALAEHLNQRKQPAFGSVIRTDTAPVREVARC